MRLDSRGRAGRIGTVCVTALVALTMAACTTQAAKTGGSDQSATTSVPTTVPGQKASGSPVKIGFVNSDTGASATPQISQGAVVAANRVNEYENGMNGHVLDLIPCSTDGTPEASAACANTFVSDGVVAVIGGADLGTDAMIPILSGAGIATIGTSTLGTSQSLNSDAFFYAPPATTYPEEEVDLAAKEGVKHLTLVLPDVAQVPIVTSLGAKQATLDGIGFTVVTFDPAAPDFASVMASVTSNGSDGIATIATDGWCDSLIRAATSAGFHGKIIAGECSAFVADLGAAETAGIYTLSAGRGPTSIGYAPKAAQTVVDQYEAAMAAAGNTQGVIGLAWVGYADVEQSAGVLRTISGDLSAPTVMAAMRNLKDAPNPIGQPITCSPRPFPGYSGCTPGWLTFVQQADGTAKPVSNGFVETRT